VVLSHGPNRAPLCGFATYIDPRKPVLLRRIGWEVSNDIHDDFTDVVSRDNGRTWSEPYLALRNQPVPGGFICHTENAALFLPERKLLIHWTNDKLESSLEGGCDLDLNCRVRITEGEPDAVSRGTAPDQFVSDFGSKQGLCISFATPLRDSQGRVLMPIQRQMSAVGRPPPESRTPPRPESPAVGLQHGPTHGGAFPVRADMPDVFSNFWQVGLLIGEFQADGRLKWRLSAMVPCEFDKSSRGMMEGTLAELAGGRFCMILRGSNRDWPERQSYKWLSFSTDRGETWSEPEPLPCDDGSLLESSSTGSALFRSLRSGKLYWIGNLCLEGPRPNGNMPRSPLYIAEMQENPVAFKRKTITAIDRVQPGEHPDTQHSNFKFYQDRVTGDLVLYLTRYGERGYDNDRWILADLYQYRIALED
jgi:hypothetical protein